MRIYTIQAARKEQGLCEACNQPILVGSSYKYIAPRYGPKKKRHATCPTWRASEMSSSKMATAWAAQEDAGDQLDGMFATVMDPETEASEYGDDPIAGIESDIKGILDAAAEEARNVIDEYQESLDAIPEHLQDGPVGQQIQDNIQGLEEWADELEGWSADAKEDDEKLADWLQAAIDSAREVVDTGISD